MSPLIWTEFRPDLGKFDEFQKSEPLPMYAIEESVVLEALAGGDIGFNPNPADGWIPAAVPRHWFMARVG